MAYAKGTKMARLVIHLTPEEHLAFDQWAQFGAAPKVSMSAAARELFRLAVAGKVNIDRPGAKARARNVPPMPAKARRAKS